MHHGDGAAEQMCNGAVARMVTVIITNGNWGNHDCGYFMLRVLTKMSRSGAKLGQVIDQFLRHGAKLFIFIC